MRRGVQRRGAVNEKRCEASRGGVNEKRCEASRGGVNEKRRTDELAADGEHLDENDVAEQVDDDD